MIHRLAWWRRWLGAMAVCGMVIAIWPYAVAAESTLARIKREGVIRVGFANEAPFAAATSAGKLTGEAPAVAAHIMQALGIEQLEGVLTEFGSLIPALRAKRFDMIAAGMFILPKRCKQIAFSEPTYCLGQAFAVKADNPLALHSYQDVAKHPKARLGVMAGAVERDYARAEGIPDERVMTFPDGPSGLAGVQAGRIDAFALTSLSIQDLLNKSQDAGLERATPFIDPVIDGKSVRGCGAFGFRQEDRDLLVAVNEKLQAYLGSASHLEAVKPFGFTAAELPGEWTTEKLCTP